MDFPGGGIFREDKFVGSLAQAYVVAEVGYAMQNHVILKVRHFSVAGMNSLTHETL